MLTAEEAIYGLKAGYDRSLRHLSGICTRTEVGEIEFHDLYARIAEKGMGLETLGRRAISQITEHFSSDKSVFILF